AAVKECLQRVLSHASDEESLDDVLKLVFDAGADTKKTPPDKVKIPQVFPTLAEKKTLKMQK
ncbi:7229_t:CDS:1, partial [Paraglomus brasilianum]